jgi:hypothetical protein
MKLPNINQSSFLLMLFSPALGVFLSIKNLGWEQRKWALIIFSTIYASIMVIDEGVDSYRYIQFVHGYAGMSFQEFLIISSRIIQLNPLPGYPADLYVHVLNYFFGSLIGLPGLFFPFVGFIYGYFYINALSKILIWTKGKKFNLLFWSIIFLFIIHRTFFNMQTVRSWTGLWVLFNGVFGYFQTKNKKFIALALLSPLIHFGYLAIAIPFFLSIIFKKIPNKIYIVFYLASFFVSISQQGILTTASETRLGESKIDTYYNEFSDPIIERKKRTEQNWYTKYGSTDSSYIGGNALAVTLLLGGFFRKKMTSLESGLFTVGLLMATMANFGSFIYTFYSRTMANAVLYFLATAALLCIRGEIFSRKNSNKSLISFLLWISVLIHIPKVFYTLASFIQFTSIYFFALPFIAWFSDKINVSIREVLGWFI